MPDSAPTPVFSAPGWLRPVLVVLFAGFVVGYILVLVPYISPFAGGSDSSGYLSSAKLLGQGKFITSARSLPGSNPTAFGSMVFQPLGFLLQESSDRMVPTYPLGLPLHLLVGSWFVGWNHAATAVNLLAVLASGGLVWALARLLGLSPVTAGAGVIVLWLCPLFLFIAMQPMSDLLALNWSLAAVYSALRARQNIRWGFLCGAAIGVAVLVRPTNILLFAPVLVALGIRWRTYLALGLGGLPSAILLLFYNWKTYGSPVSTGYGDVSAAFSLGNLPHNLLHFARWIPDLLSPLVVLAIAAPFITKAHQRGPVVLAVWSATLIGFYGFYYYAGETWWYLRFILPVFPLLILAALAVLETAWLAVRIRPGMKAAIAALLLLFTAGWQSKQIRPLDVPYLKENEKSYPDAARWAQQNLPARAAILCMQVSGAFFYYTDFLLIRWDQVDSDKYGALFAAVAKDDRPVYAALFPFEAPEALERAGGKWTKLSTVGQVTFWQRQP